MDILHTILIKISGAIAAVLILVGAPINQQTTTIVDVQPTGEAVSTTTAETVVVPTQTPTITVVVSKPQLPATTQASTTPIEPPVVTVPIIIQQPDLQPTSAPQPQPQPEVAPQVVTEPELIPMTYTLEIISPIRGKGLGREYFSNEKLVDEANYVDIGVIVRLNGEPVKDATVVITTDAPGSKPETKELVSTGNVATIYVNGSKQVVPYYPVHHEFKMPGKHTITFTSNGQTATVDLLAKPDNRTKI